MENDLVGIDQLVPRAICSQKVGHFGAAINGERGAIESLLSEHEQARIVADMGVREEDASVRKRVEGMFDAFVGHERPNIAEFAARVA